MKRTHPRWSWAQAGEKLGSGLDVNRRDVVGSGGERIPCGLQPFHCLIRHLGEVWEGNE